MRILNYLTLPVIYSENFYEYLTYEKTSRMFVPWKWMAIEYLQNDFFTLKSDVWSYAVLVWEILSFGRNPYGHQEYDEVLRKLESGYRLPVPTDVDQISLWSPASLYKDISEKCFTIDPEKRLNFSNVVQMLEEELSSEEMMIYKQMHEIYQATRANIYLKMGRSAVSK